MTDEQEIARRRAEIERPPVPTSARDRLVLVVAGTLGTGEGDALMRAVGDEIRAALTVEHEDDLDRIRPAMFDLGVRTTLRILSERGTIPATAEEALIAQLDAEASRVEFRRRIREAIVPMLGPGNDDAAAEAEAEPIILAALRALP